VVAGDEHGGEQSWPEWNTVVDERLCPATKACGYITSDSRDAGSPGGTCGRVH